MILFREDARDGADGAHAPPKFQLELEINHAECCVENDMTRQKFS